MLVLIIFYTSSVNYNSLGRYNLHLKESIITKIYVFTLKKYWHIILCQAAWLSSFTSVVYGFLQNSAEFFALNLATNIFDALLHACNTHVTLSIEPLEMLCAIYFCIPKLQTTCTHSVTYSLSTKL
jgi:hypothetical protein